MVVSRALAVGLVLVCMLSIARAATDTSKLVILRGTPGSSGSTALTFVADENGLASAQLAGISGTELLAAGGQRLLEQADVYRQAQRAAGNANPGPLYVVLDPTGTWAYAQPWGTFTYQRDGKSFGPVTTPFLHLGEQMDHQGQAVEPTDESTAVNQQIVAKTQAWFTQQLQTKNVKRIPDFQKEVLDSWKITIGGAPAKGLSQTTADLTSDRFLSYIQTATTSALSSYGIDSKAFDAFRKSGGIDDLVAQGQKDTLAHEVTETVSHELGHVIQFAALGLYKYKGAQPAVYMNGSNHTLATLSTPQFALVEGWGEANSMVVVGMPKDRTPGAANRIDYSTTADYLPQAINDRVGRLVSAKLHADGLLDASTPLTTPPLSSDPAQFRAGLADAAKKAGMSADAWSALSRDIDADQDLKDLQKSKDYVTGLQAKKGQLRSRYDFLRSEYAVAGVLAKLRQALGLDATKDVMSTLAKHNPPDLAALIEDYVHDYPARKEDTYRVVAQATEGILITPAQVAAVQADDAAGHPTEIDVDQDGHVPGVSANAAHPDQFPRDMPAPGQEPLPAPRAPAGTPAMTEAIAPAQGAVSDVVLTPPTTGPRTIPPAETPAMDGIENG